MRFKLLMSAMLAGSMLASAGMSYADDVTAERLGAAGTDAEAGNWLSVHKDWAGSRHSTLDEINAANVSGLKLAFAVPLGGAEPAGFGAGSMEATPLANNGFLYISDPWGTPYKIDVSDGKQGKMVWSGETGVDKDPNVYHYTNPTQGAVPVTVKVEKVNPKLSVIYYDTLLLTQKGDEKTVVRFRMDKDGAISDINTVPVSLIQAVRK